MRILATPANVDVLFKPTTLPYAYHDSEGEVQSVDLPAWECRACGWKSLKGIQDLPFPHSCEPATERLVARTDETFTA